MCCNRLYITDVTVCIDPIGLVLKDINTIDIWINLPTFIQKLKVFFVVLTHYCGKLKSN